MESSPPRFFLNQLKNKKMRAANLPDRLPQALPGRRPATPQLSLFDCGASNNSVPPKELQPAFSNRERMPPPRLPLTTISEPDPIYPYFTLLVLLRLLGNERADTHAIPTRLKQSSFLREPLQIELAPTPKQSLTHRWPVQLPYI